MATTSPPRAPRRSWLPAAAVTLAVAAAAAAAGFAAARLVPRPTAPAPEPTESTAPAGDGRVAFPSSRREAAGVRTEPAVVAPLTDRVWRTGRLALDEERIAHVSPPVEGVVRESPARLGRRVAAGEVLAVLDSREIGRAKLELVQARLAAESARTQEEWTATVGRNAEAVLEVLAADPPLAEVERKFKDRPLGDWRQQLFTAYSRRAQARVQRDDMNRLGGGALSESALRRARGEAEAADAQFTALCEELRFQSRQQARLAGQKLREARAAEDVARAQLLMVGYSRAEVDALDPVAEGGRVSLHPLRAPFAGTIVEKHCVLSERVGPQHEMFRIADLTTVWVRADLFDADLPLLRGPGARQVVFRAPAAGVAERPAEVLYAGDLIDAQSRALTLTATAPNPDGVLKPGLFVEVGLSRGDGASVLQVPAEAVQRHEGRAFVFVPDGDDAFRRVDVTVGRSAGDRVEVTSGLVAGQAVVSSGAFVLKSELLRGLIAGE
jgi:cobalt-zinc-cadmium efflux system membrane fusion protein